MEQSIEKVHSLIDMAEKAASNGACGDAMQLSQAALNAAKAVETLDQVARVNSPVNPEA